MTRKKYLNDIGLKQAMTKTIADVRMEQVDGAPRIVVYFSDEELGLVLSRQMAEQLSAAFGPHPLVDQFLSMQ